VNVFGPYTKLVSPQRRQAVNHVRGRIAPAFFFCFGVREKRLKLLFFLNGHTNWKFLLVEEKTLLQLCKYLPDIQ
jgi:hypothetical protein